MSNFTYAHSDWKYKNKESLSVMLLCRLLAQSLQEGKLLRNPREPRLLTSQRELKGTSGPGTWLLPMVVKQVRFSGRTPRGKTQGTFKGLHLSVSLRVICVSSGASAGAARQMTFDLFSSPFSQHNPHSDEWWKMDRCMGG